MNSEIKNNHLFTELTPNLKRSLMLLLAERERSFFYQLFNDYESEYSMPSQIIYEIMMSIEAEECTCSSMYISVGE